MAERISQEDGIENNLSTSSLQGGADKKKGYALYVTSGGTFDNDLWCVVLCDGGIIRHYTSSQILMQHNGTFEITKVT